MTLFWIGIGGAAGSILRYILGGAVQRLSARGFPVGTLAVNVIGCLLVGILLQRFMHQQTHPMARAALIVGFCGGFTTFSTFAGETIGLISGGETTRAFTYAVLSMLLCLSATWAGMFLTRAAGARF